MKANSKIAGRKKRLNVAAILAAGTNGLGAVRSLESKGIASIVACRTRYDEAYLSRFPIRKVLIPGDVDLAEWLPSFVESVSSIADCIIPTSDEYTSALRGCLGSFSDQPPCILPPDDLVDVLNDKKSEIQLILEMGIHLPVSVLDMRQLFERKNIPRFPIIVKPRTYQEFAILGAKNRIVANEIELGEFLTEFDAHLGGFVAQEVIPGDESCQWVCNATFDNNSDMVSAFTFNRLGTVPYRFGVTTFAVSKQNHEVKNLCARIARDLKYTGPAMFEFKVDPRSGQYCYIEINPRLGLCNWFDTRCGINNVYNTYALSIGECIDTVVDEQIDGVTYLNLPIDVYARLRARQGFWTIIKFYASNLPKKVVPSAWYWRDPLPSVSHIITVIIRAVRWIAKR